MKKKYLQSTGAVNGSDSADAAEGVVALNKDGSPRKKAGRPRKVKPEDDEAVGNGVKSGKGKRKAKGSKRKDADDEEYDGARSQQKRVKTQNTGAGDTDTDGEFAM